MTAVTRRRELIDPALHAIGAELATLEATRTTLPPLEARARLDVLREWLTDVRATLPDPLPAPTQDVMRRYRDVWQRIQREKATCA